MRNKANTFLVFSFICVFNIGFSAEESRLLLNTHSKSFKEKLIDIETISKGLITREMFYSIPVRNLDEDPIFKFLISDSTIYAMQDCQLNVWEWNDTAWVNRVKDNYKGWCIPNYYLYKKNIIGFTGSGFWTSNSGIYSFDLDSNNWKLINVKNKAPHFVSKVDFKIGNDTIVSLMVGGFEKHVNKRGEKINSYGFDLRVNKWFNVESYFELNMFSNFYTENVFDMENTVHVLFKEYHLILDKKSLTFYYISEKKMIDYDFYYNFNSSVTCIINGEHTFIKDEVPANAVFAGTIKFTEFKNVKSENQKNNFFLWAMIGLVFMFLFGISLVWRLVSSKNKIQSPQKSPVNLISIIAERTGEILDSNEIDLLIGIDNDNSPDLRRAKRSRIIKDVNIKYEKLEGKFLITRQKSPIDNRYMLYYIEK